MSAQYRSYELVPGVAAALAAGHGGERFLRPTLPPELHPASLVKVGMCRTAQSAFVRPSGTEDVVRVYAEAATQADADALALKTA